MTADATLDLSAPVAAAGGNWVVVTERGAAPERVRVPRLRSALLQVGAAALVVVAVVAIVGGLISRRTAESQSVHEAAQLTNVLAESVVQPALTDAMATSTTAAAGARSARPHARAVELARPGQDLDPAGRIVYSDEPRLVGAQLRPRRRARAPRSTDPQVRAEISDLDEPENRFERGQGTMLEVYRPVWTPSGQPLLFETYFRYDQVSRARRAAVARLRRHHVEQHRRDRRPARAAGLDAACARARRAHAAARGDDAARDGRVRSTSGGGSPRRCTTASCRSWSPRRSRSPAAPRTPPRGATTELAERLRDAGETVRTSIGGMRSLLVDIYPPNLRDGRARARAARPRRGRCALERRASTSTTTPRPRARPPSSRRRCSGWPRSACATPPRTPTRRAIAPGPARRCGRGRARDRRRRRRLRSVDHCAARATSGCSLIDDLARKAGAELAVRTRARCGHDAGDCASPA